MKSKEERIEQHQKEIDRIKLEEDLIDGRIYDVSQGDHGHGVKHSYLKWNKSRDVFETPEGYPLSLESINSYYLV